MDEIEIKTIVHKVCSVYKNRGYVTVAEIQDLLDAHYASLVETNRVFQRLLETGCKVSENSTNDEDFKFYDETVQNIKDTVIRTFSSFLLKEKIDNISGLEYSLYDYENGIIYYLYLRLIMKLAKVTAKKHIVDLQKAYEKFLPEGEAKNVFDIRSAAFIQKVFLELKDPKKHRKVPREQLTAVANYQHFLSRNSHSVLAQCEAAIDNS